VLLQPLQPQHTPPKHTHTPVHERGGQQREALGVEVVSRHVQTGELGAGAHPQEVRDGRRALGADLLGDLDSNHAEGCCSELRR
jgi:hypothetical protein